MFSCCRDPQAVVESSDSGPGLQPVAPPAGEEVMPPVDTKPHTKAELAAPSAMTELGTMPPTDAVAATQLATEGFQDPTVRAEPQNESTEPRVRAETEKSIAEPKVRSETQQTIQTLARGGATPKSAQSVYSAQGLPPGTPTPFPSDMMLNTWTAETHAPFVGLVNPKSGGQKGLVILDVVSRSPAYKERIFHIVHVAIDKDGVMAEFRTKLFKAKAEAEAKNDPRFRPRCIAGGGDGTAAFAINIILRALRAHTPEEDKGNGFVWSDEEIEKYFPALVQMPLGTGNDLGGVLGWGRKYPGHAHVPFVPKSCHGAALQRWFDEALLVTTPVYAFDAWAFMPPGNEETMPVKVCELAKLERRDGKKRYIFKTPDPPVPFLTLLYAGFGFFANVAMRFAIARTSSQIGNILQYAKISPQTLFFPAPQEIKPKVSKLEVYALTHDESHHASASSSTGCTAKVGTKIFPPRPTANAMRYDDVGFMNINSLSAGIFKAGDRTGFLNRCLKCGLGRIPPRWGDGLIDVYRMKMPATIVKGGTKFQVNKVQGARLHFKGRKGEGLVMQYDGEARYVFCPEGKEWDMDFILALTIPMVVRAGSGHPDDRKPGSFKIHGDAVRRRILKWIEPNDGLKDCQATRRDIEGAGFHVLEV